jgi:hypothetical protein
MVAAVVVLLAVISAVAAAVETVGNRINYLIEKGNHWFPFSVEEVYQFFFATLQYNLTHEHRKRIQRVQRKDE